MNKNKIIISICVAVGILLLLGGAYWYLYMRPVPGGIVPNSPLTNIFGGAFGNNTPSEPNTSGTNSPSTNPTGTSTAPTTTNTPSKPLPTLRLLSDLPVGGYGASTTANGTVVRWVERGRGNVYETHGDTSVVTIISNTILPMVYNSVWNKNLTSFMGSLFMEGSTDTVNVYAELRAQDPNKVSSTTGQNSNESKTPYDLRGKNLSTTIVSFAASPKKDKVFIFAIENGQGVGYIQNFGATSMTQLFKTPITQVNIEWPEDTTIAITTKGSATSGGFLYFVNIKTGEWKKILGPLSGLSTKVSHDAKYVAFSVTGNNQNMLTSIYNVDKGSGTDAVFRTLADKCAWGNFYKNMLYCAVPSQPTKAIYPDAWYQGTVSFIDKIWQENAVNNEVHQISTIVDTSGRIIDGFNLELDSSDDYLYFMNKNDLSLWSLDLVNKN